MMKDRIFLLVVGILCSAVAWAFWHYAGAMGYDIISLLFLVAIAADNIRLRRLLRSLRR